MRLTRFGDEKGWGGLLFGTVTTGIGITAIEVTLGQT